MRHPLEYITPLALAALVLAQQAAAADTTREASARLLAQIEPR